MGWALLPTTWFTNEYKRQLQDTHTYQLIDNFNIEQHIKDSNKLILNMKTRFANLITRNKHNLLDPLQPEHIQLPYMKLLPKVHKLISTASPNNVTDLTGRPIITAHSWTTSNISRLLGTELDNTFYNSKTFLFLKTSNFL